ncbi:hypothetical protein BGZ80_008578 [Entomortierella chlamydospora]|uniref:Arginine N-methyltransferase 2 n=1 Tax=Entomortierella chlamydospora TaxID=101097 RepID=A0A9P6N4X7_9FUNG|nr:hypothetical protein BGZ79_010663 [Entomortierella chlamydospora]KAG0023664.1 hypothetical protein BGZ80_008578 [Entomortierella chlamydospora]
MHSKSLISLALLSTITTVTVAAASSHRQCRCLPSQSCWPSESSWSALSQSVGGRLIATKPAAYECHDPHYDSAKCDEIQKGYYYDYWRQLQPGAVQQTNWEVIGNKGCLGFNQTAPCYQGAVPLYTVNATSIEDVQSAVRFAAKNNIRLVVKNTGHDYIGRSIGASSLNLWVYFMKNFSFTDSFVPEGAPSGSSGIGAIVLDSGVLWKDVYKAADEQNVIVVGGAEGTVGTSGGYCQGGGHSPLSPLHGLCVDNVLQYKVVTADGELKVANSYQNKDLFWALRGGGGATFGVVVEATYKTHPAVKSLNYATYLLSFNGTETRHKLINNFLSHQAKWSDEGWSGYSYLLNDYIAVIYYLPDTDVNTANSSISPFFEYAKSLGNVQVEGIINNYPTFWETFLSAPSSPNATNAGANTLLGSRLIPRRNFESCKGVDQLTNAIIDIQQDLVNFGNTNGTIITHLVAGGEVSKGNSEDTSVLPAWRKALMHIVASTGWADDTPVAVQHLFARKLTQATQRLRDLSPGSGAYFNEADANEPNWQTNFFGSNYARLKAIKDEVDPHGLFVCRNCVGSEDWNMADTEEHTHRNPVPESNLVKTEEIIEASSEEVAKSQALMEAVAAGKVEKVEELLKDGANHSARAAHGRTMLHFATMIGSLPIVKLLLSYGHPWNLVDDDYKSVGDYAKSFNHPEIYDFLLEEGVRTELLMGLIQRKLRAELYEADQGDDDEDEQEKKKEGQTEETSGQSETTTTDNESEPATKKQKVDDKKEVPNASYLAQPLQYTEDGDRLLDAEKNGVMMGWELPLMVRHAEVISPEEGLRVLNVGFGLGLIDKELQKRSPSQHTIIEAHPDVYAHMLKEGWDKKPGVKILFGRWQDVVDQLEVYDGIFFDTFGEYYEDLRAFHEIVPNHLEEGGIYSYFNGLGATNEFFHAVYNRISELELGEMGFSVEYEEMDIGLKEEEWNGVKRAYWTLDKYYLPICRLDGF